MQLVTMKMPSATIADQLGALTSTIGLPRGHVLYEFRRADPVGSAFDLVAQVRTIDEAMLNHQREHAGTQRLAGLDDIVVPAQHALSVAPGLAMDDGVALCRLRPFGELGVGEPLALESLARVLRPIGIDRAAGLAHEMAGAPGKHILPVDRAGEPALAAFGTAVAGALHRDPPRKP